MRHNKSISNLNKKLTSLLLCLTIVVASSAQSIKSIESKIDSILPLLTLEEKVAMCHAQSKFSSPGVPRSGISKMVDIQFT